MRTTHIFSTDNRPDPVDIVGEKVTILGENDLSKPFEAHIQEGLEGGGPKPHHHPWDEAFFVLEGEVELTLGQPGDVELIHGKETHFLSAGGYVHIPGDTVHGYTNKSPKTVLLGIVSDSKGGQLFRAMDKIPFPEGLPQVIEVAEKFGLTMLPVD